MVNVRTLFVIEAAVVEVADNGRLCAVVTVSMELRLWWWMRWPWCVQRPAYRSCCCDCGSSGCHVALPVIVAVVWTWLWLWQWQLNPSGRTHRLLPALIVRLSAEREGHSAGGPASCPSGSVRIASLSPPPMPAAASEVPLAQYSLRDCRKPSSVLAVDAERDFWRFCTRWHCCSIWASEAMVPSGRVPDA